MADHQGMTALHVACLYGHRTIVRLLAQEGANLRCVDKDLTTPMHLACAEGLKQVRQSSYLCTNAGPSSEGIYFPAETLEQRLGRRAIKELMAMETYKKQRNRYQLCLFLFSNKRITYIVFCGCANGCSKFVSGRYLSNMKLLYV